ncbi:hypothetical protein BC835DRAFT_1411160 [Cytidiella melzeri]|nr:hypothetical protein BC835DRAFT_1411160 [Cytidiella melzeri]
MDASEYATSAQYLMVAKMYSLASCGLYKSPLCKLYDLWAYTVMLFYDMFITFGEEVEKIWMQPFTSATLLWFVNRYLTPLGFIVITVGFHDPKWGPAECERYVRFPEYLKIFSATAVGIYGRSRFILVSFIFLLLAEIGIKIWSFMVGIPLQLPPGLFGCVLTGKTNRVMYTWVAELAFDTCVFVAMLYRTVYLYVSLPNCSRTSSITHVLLRDGVVYFGVISVSNLVTVLIYVFAIPALKVINASFSTLITTLMVSRLILNLRKSLLPSDGETTEASMVPSLFIHVRNPPPQSMVRSQDYIPMSEFDSSSQGEASAWRDLDERAIPK